MKTALVTGASSGIGAAIATSFVDAGYSVVAAGRDEKKLNKLFGNCPQIHIWSGDLSQSQACNALMQFTLAKHKTLDVLVNNAGVIHRRDAINTTDEIWRQTMGINLDAAFYMSRAALPALIARKGRIINIASDWGLVGGEMAAAYCASKGALVLLTKAMALDHALDGVTVNSICPGDVDTPMLKAEAKDRGVDYKKAMQENNASSPTGRITKPQEVAALALFLASAEAAQITGTAIPIDGGNLA